MKFLFYIFRSLPCVLSILLTGCGTLVGNTGPVEEKSDQYEVADLTKKSPDWEKLPPRKDSVSSSAQADIAYQSKSTSSIISVISACRPRDSQKKTTKEDLRSLTNPLFMGAKETISREEKNINLNGLNALQTTFFGKIENEKVAIRAVVFRLGPCVYDLIYSSVPQSFHKNEEAFTYFVSSFRIRK